ncbi:hypothetical protein F2Q68_00022340, partial [Brassica cretica]
YSKEGERDEDFEVGEVEEVQDNQSVVSLKSNNSDLTKKTNDEETKEKGGWTNALILLDNTLRNQGLATLAFSGVGVNLVLFLTRDNLSKWTKTVYMFSLVGAFLSDSYWGRYLTCTIFQVIFVLGVSLLSFTSWFFLLKPKGCGDGNFTCDPPSSLGVGIFYLSVYMVAFVYYGGHQPTLGTIGADKFGDNHNKTSKAAFFSYFYVALNVGSLFSNTILVYFEDRGLWTLGFLVSLGSAIIALVAFLGPTKRYRYVKPCGNPLPRVAQVFVATALIFTQMASLFVEQGDVMNAYIGKFHTPAASMSVFDFPYVRPTELMRMGVGLIIGIMAMVAAGLTEIQWLRRIVSGQEESELTILWQIRSCGSE